MTLLFGNYNPGRQSSAYDVPQSTIFDLRGSSFERGDDIEVRPFWISNAAEEGNPEIIMLTYAVPLVKNYQPLFPGDKPFSCHVCSPLIGAAVFVKSGSEWRAVSSRTVVTRRGSWGQPPDSIRLVRVGPMRIGVEMTDTYIAQGEMTTTVLCRGPARLTRHSQESYRMTTRGRAEGTWLLAMRTSESLSLFPARTPTIMTWS